MSSSTAVRIGIDTGGTFTDVVVAVDGRVRAFKIPSSPDDPSRAILTGIDRALAEDGPSSIDLTHGTTVGTNALLERKGARTAFIATEGFQDLLAIGRQARPRLYDIRGDRASPLSPPDLWFGVDERVASTGDVLVRPTAGRLDEIIAAVKASGAESVALCLLFSFANPEHERQIEQRLADLGVPVSSSHRILPEYREYERASTVVVNAFLVPRMKAYLDRLSAETAGRGVATVRVMQSSGGAISAETAAAEPVRTILSGPAGGVVAAAHLSRVAGFGDLVTFDMGGTSTDVAFVADGKAPMTNEAQISGLPVAVPVIDIHTVGAGGGSIARVDAGGALRVGPESAGADPGPACYGKGDRATVTDANVVLGRLGVLLGGALTLDAGRAYRALEDLARAMTSATGTVSSPEEAALGVVRVASANMARALRVVSIERGADPRNAALLSFGGAGGLHACALAEALGMRRVVVPIFPGAFSALGLLLGDVVRDVSRTVIGLDLDGDAMERVISDLEAAAHEALAAERVAPERMQCARVVAMRYRGQSFELDIPWGDGAFEAFHAAHERRYGHSDPTRPVEIVHVRVRATGVAERVELPAVESSETREAHPTGTRSVRFDDDWREVQCFDRDALAAGDEGAGPALVVEYGSTTLVAPGWRFRVDRMGNLTLWMP